MALLATNISNKEKAMVKLFWQSLFIFKAFLIVGLSNRYSKMIAKLKVIKECNTRVSERVFSANDKDTGAKESNKKVTIVNSIQKFGRLTRSFNV